MIQVVRIAHRSLFYIR